MAADGPPLLRMLDLEQLDRDLYRSTFTFDDPFNLYGGQVAAQSLLAAGRCVEPGRPPHSLHGYFLRPGDARAPIIFQVYRDRDGRSYSARRVVAVQDGDVIFNMSASFHVADDGPDAQLVTMPADVVPASQSKPLNLFRLFNFEAAAPPVAGGPYEFPIRFWARTDIALPDDPLVHAAAITYVSDISSGLVPLHSPQARSTTSLDHAIWFHRFGRADGWLLTDLVGRSAAEGRGWYTGSIFDESGRLLASLAQETLFRFRHDFPTRRSSGED
jgi:acyl-CoA thioesterase-2